MNLGRTGAESHKQGKETERYGWRPNKQTSRNSIRVCVGRPGHRDSNRGGWIAIAIVIAICHRVPSLGNDRLCGYLPFQGLSFFGEGGKTRKDPGGMARCNKTAVLPGTARNATQRNAPEIRPDKTPRDHAGNDEARTLLVHDDRTDSGEEGFTPWTTGIEKSGTSLW